MFSCILQFVLFLGTTRGRRIRLNNFRAVLKTAAFFCCLLPSDLKQKQHIYSSSYIFSYFFNVKNRISESQNNYSGKELNAGVAPKLDQVLRPSVLSFSRDGDPTSSLGSLCRCLTTFMMKHFPDIKPECSLLRFVTTALVISVCISGESLPLSSL